MMMMMATMPVIVIDYWRFGKLNLTHHKSSYRKLVSYALFMYSCTY